MADQLIGESIEPVPGPWDVAAMARGEPGLPGRFRWRGREYRVREVLRRWKTTGPCRSGSPEQYVRRHWFRVRTGDGVEMTLYFERQPRSPRRRSRRWWVHAVSRAV